MEQNTPKFRLRLNLFDTIVLVLALAVGAFLLWRAVKPAAPVQADPTATSTGARSGADARPGEPPLGLGRAGGL